MIGRANQPGRPQSSIRVVLEAMVPGSFHNFGPRPPGYPGRILDDALSAVRIAHPSRVFTRGRAANGDRWVGRAQ